MYYDESNGVILEIANLFYDADVYTIYMEYNGSVYEVGIVEEKWMFHLKSKTKEQIKNSLNSMSAVFVQAKQIRQENFIDRERLTIKIIQNKELLLILWIMLWVNYLFISTHML